MLYHISLLPIYDSRSKWNLVSCSSYQNGGDPARMIDDDLSTRWESRYNNTGEGDINPNEHRPYGIWARRTTGAA